MTTNTQLIALFNKALIEPEQSSVSFEYVNTVAMQRGYLVHPKVCNKSVLEFLDTVNINYNSTFYTSWQEVASNSELEMLTDQILHYITNYCSDYKINYVPNKGEYIVLFNNYKLILPALPEEMYNDCKNLIYSGIALKQNTMSIVCDFMVEHYENDIDVDSIPNREAQTYLCDKLNIYPTKPISLFRYIIYKTTGKTMIIKNKALSFVELEPLLREAGFREPQLVVDEQTNEEVLEDVELDLTNLDKSTIINLFS